MSRVDPVVDTVDEARGWSASDKTLAKALMATLHRHYPGHEWGVGVHRREGCVIIRKMDVPSKYVYMIAPKDVDWPELRCAVKAGGVILESLGIRRGRYNYENEMSLKRTPAGLIYPDWAAVPEKNPGFEEVRKHHQAMQDEQAAILDAPCGEMP